MYQREKRKTERKVVAYKKNPNPKTHNKLPNLLIQLQQPGWGK